MLAYINSTNQSQDPTRQHDEWASRKPYSSGIYVSLWNIYRTCIYIDRSFVMMWRLAICSIYLSVQHWQCFSLLWHLLFCVFSLNFQFITSKRGCLSRHSTRCLWHFPFLHIIYTSRLGRKPGTHTSTHIHLYFYEVYIYTNIYVCVYTLQGNMAPGIYSSIYMNCSI